MLSDENIIEYFCVEDILKKYSPSGQKQVLLIKHKTYGVVILKIVEGQSVRRHIVGGANRTLISAITSLRSCGIGTCRRLSSG